jgi:hypothetical protein
MCVVGFAGARARYHRPDHPDPADLLRIRVTAPGGAFSRKRGSPADSRIFPGNPISSSAVASGMPTRCTSDQNALVLTGARLGAREGAGDSGSLAFAGADEGPRETMRVGSRG